MDVNALYKRGYQRYNSNDLAGALSDFEAVAAASSAIEGVVALAFTRQRLDMREEAAAAVLLAAERAAAAARADAAVLPAFCEMTAQLLGSLRHVDDAVRSIDDDCRQRRDAPPADEPPPPPPPPRPSPPPPLPPQNPTQLPCDEAMDAAAPDAPADPPPLVALGETSICATINDGTNAQLHDWLRLQGCAGARRIFLRDARSLDAAAAAVARWMLEPFVEAGTLVLLNASAAAPASTTPADAALVPLFEGDWPPPRRAWLAGEARRDEAAQVQACLPHARDAGGWMAVVEAPYDLRGAQRDGSRCRSRRRQ